MPARFLIAPDKFKGSLTAPQAAEAIVAGILRQNPSAIIDLCPIADGGEGFMETLAAAMDGKWIHCPAVDPLGRAISSRYVLAETPEGPTAILEMAEASGLWRLTPDERDPLRATTRGTGMQIAHAISEHAVKRIILGLGGSATNDGGAGMAAALGIDFLNDQDEEIDPIPANLPAVRRIDAARRIRLPMIIAACDVENPLLGTQGATTIFSAQKGSTPESRVSLETALSHLVEVSHAPESAATPGAGAAGGLGFGLLHFAGARLQSGFDLLANLLDLETRVRDADFVITGEGSIDHQSLSGKGPVALARMAKRLNVPVTGFCGIADQEARDSSVFTTLHALADSGLPLETLIHDAASLLTELVANTQFSKSMKTPFITEAEAIKEDFKGRTNFWMCHPDITNAKDLQVCRAVLPAGECHNFHHHPELEEAIYVLEGEVEQWVGEEKQVLKVGEAAHMGPGVIHATFNVSDKDAVILAILSPGSQIGPFMVDVSTEEPWASIRG